MAGGGFGRSAACRFVRPPAAAGSVPGPVGGSTCRTSSWPPWVRARRAAGGGGGFAHGADMQQRLGLAHRFCGEGKTLFEEVGLGLKSGSSSYRGFFGFTEGMGIEELWKTTHNDCDPRRRFLFEVQWLSRNRGVTNPDIFGGVSRYDGG